jgi:YidC/Oxa1 family membrane protein insertase
MQQRNLVWFMVLSFLILFSWVWLQNQIWPPKPRTPKEDKTAQKTDWRKYGAVASAANLIGNRGLALGGLSGDLRLGQDLLFIPAKSRALARWEDLSEKQRQIALLLPQPTPINLAALAPLGATKAQEPPAEVIPFGDDKNYHLQGSFTTRGAGVRKMTLNKFQGANWLGEPIKGGLEELIPDDPEFASFLMYHYPAEKRREWENPVQALGQQIWKFESKRLIDKDNPLGPTQEFRFSTDVPEEAYKHLRIFKTYRLAPRDYHLTLLIEIQDTRTGPEASSKAAPFRYQLMGAHGLPIEGIWYTSTYRDAVIGMVDSRGSLVRTKEDAMHISVKKGGDAVPDPPAPFEKPVPWPGSSRGDSYLIYAGVTTQYFASVIAVDNKQPSEADGGGDGKQILRWARPTLESDETKGILKDWTDKDVLVAEGGHLLEYLLLPRVKQHIADAKLTKEDHVVISYYKLDNGRRVATGIRLGESPRSYLDDITVRVNSELLELKPGQKVAHQFLLYHGPVKTKLLGQFSGDKEVPAAEVDRYTNTLHLRTLTDYRSAGPFGAFSQAIHFTDLLIAITNLMHGLLYLLHFLVGSYGLTIILLTVLVRGLMFPISRKQAYFSVKMQEIAPELKKIKEKYGNDRKAQMEATQELYRKYQINPLGSCLPLLMQMPIFLGLYYALQESIHFRLAGFLWIKNLAAPDMLLWWGEKIYYISNPDNIGGMFYLGPFLNLLPLIAVTLMIVQQKLMTPPPQDEQQEMQQKMMKYMSVFFGILFYKVASGLCIYFISSSLWGLAERRFLPKKKPALQTAGQAPLAAKPLPPPLKGRGPKGRGPSPGKPGSGKPGQKEVKTNGTVQKVKDWWAEVLKQAKKK